MFLSPILYFYLFRPLLHLVDDYRAKELELSAYQEHLKRMVDERTRELDLTVQGLKREVTERRQVEVALRESDARFRQIFAQSEDAIVLVAPASLLIADANSTAEHCFGGSREELLGVGISTLFNPGSSAELAAAMEVIGSEGTYSGLERLVTRDGHGEKRILSLRGKMINLQGEALIYMDFRDVTREVGLEEDAREIQGRLIHANRMTSLGMLVASVAHEINNPNNYILINAGLLKQSWQDILPVLRDRFQREGDFPVGRTTFARAERFFPDMVDGIVDGAHRIDMIVGNLRDLGRDDPATLMGKADLNAVIRLSAAILDHHISRTTTRFRLELCEDLPLFRGNARQMEQVVINLIMNALQALPTRNGGCASAPASTGKMGWWYAHCRRRERDFSGCWAHIMEPFFTTRQDQGRNRPGPGHQRCDCQGPGGTMEFDSEPGTGTVFTIRLQPADAVEPDRGRLTMIDDSARILVVDDELHTLKACSATLAAERLRRRPYRNGQPQRNGTACGRTCGCRRARPLYAARLRNGTSVPHQGAIPRITVVVVTAACDLQRAVECMKLGAFDYLVKPVEGERLVATVRKALEWQELTGQMKALREHLVEDRLDNPEAFAGIVTRSRKMRQIFQYLEVVARTPQPVLITGESGTGKELIVRSLHRLSGCPAPCGGKPGGLDDTLFANTLFGHKRGAYTGAGDIHEGLISRASGGVLFLDEIGELGESAQIRILRLIQEREYYPVGADTPRQCDARIVCATNRDLKSLVAAGRFRQDLYYRLNVHAVSLPPLRERREDLPLLLDHFVDHAVEDLGVRRPGYPRELLELLNAYHFPGNVRELQGMIGDAVARTQAGMLSLEPFRRVISVMLSLEATRVEASDLTRCSARSNRSGDTSPRWARRRTA